MENKDKFWKAVLAVNEDWILELQKGQTQYHGNLLLFYEVADLNELQSICTF